MRGRQTGVTTYRNQILCAMRRMLAMEIRDICKDTTEMGKTCQVQLTAIPLTK